MWKGGGISQYFFRTNIRWLAIINYTVLFDSVSMVELDEDSKVINKGDDDVKPSEKGIGRN